LLTNVHVVEAEDFFIQRLIVIHEPVLKVLLFGMLTKSSIQSKLIALHTFQDQDDIFHQL